MGDRHIPKYPKTWPRKKALKLRINSSQKPASIGIVVLLIERRR